MTACCGNPCLHPTGLVLTCNPPINVLRCCNCGKQQNEQYKMPTIPEGHGPYHPVVR